MIQTEIGNKELGKLEDIQKPVLDLAGMKNPERYQAVNATLEMLQLNPYMEQAIFQHMPEDLRRYSPRNQLLIRLQRPEIKQVKGRGQWFKEGRKLRKGCKAIWILAPNTQKKKKLQEDEEEQENLKGFFFMPIYAMEDTEEKETKEV